MPNEEIVLRPKRWGILAAWLSYPWAMAVGIPLLALADRTKAMQNRVENLVGGWLVGAVLALLVSGFLLWMFLSKKITLKKNGEICFEERVLSEKYRHTPDYSVNHRMQVLRKEVHHYSKNGRQYRVERWLLPVKMRDTVRAGDIVKFGTMQRVLPRRKPEGTEKRFPQHQIAFVFPEKRGKVWNLYCFRKAELEQLKAYIQKYNPEAKHCIE